MDEQHKKLIAMINDLNVAVSQGKGRDAVRQTLNRLVSYAAEHFADEERLMTNAAYPGFAAHKPVHEAFAAKAIALSKDFEAGRAMVGADVMIFLKDWLVTHIMGTDKKYGPFVNKVR
jgi:hemerythrin-like metal-binding protein